MTKNFTYVEKHSGDPLSHTEWNNLAQDVDALVTGVNNGTIGGSSQGGTDPHVTFDEVANGGKNNLTIATTAEDQYQDGSKTKGGKINIEPISDLQIKPGDDVCLCSHHREDPDEVSVKVLDGEDKPVKLQLNAANIVLTTKDKNKTKVKDANGDETSEALYDDPNVLNVTVNSNKNTRGYLKVRAQAIDLRCEDHGGIALQPKGEDSDHHMNKIKFEHGGGDGLEFGTFNSEKTSLFTDEYRFNKNGKILLATRTKEVSDKYDNTDETTHYKYVKQNDDFYDNIASNDPSCTWNEMATVVDLFTHRDVIVDDSQRGISLNYPGELTFTNLVTEETTTAAYLIRGSISEIEANTPYTYGDLVYIYGEENITPATKQILTGNSNFSGIVIHFSDGHASLTKTNTAAASLKDIITLVNFFKTGAGQADGPWNNV